jgi:hypothetical protein
MPPGTITIGGKAMNKNVVYFGGAAALGVVGYAWFKNSQTGPEILTADPNLAPVGEPTDIPGFSVYGPDNARIPQTNAEWYDLVISKAQSIGVDAAAMGTAIGKYLGRQPLTKAEIELVRMAIASSGNPPEGGPYNIIEIPSGGVTPPPAPIPVPPGIPAPAPVTPSPPSTPTNFKAAGGKGEVWLAWDPVPGATWYEWKRQDSPWINNGGLTALRHPQLVNVDSHYAYAVRAGNAAGYSGAATDDTWILA